MGKRTSPHSAPLNVLVVGTGMYVCGRGTEGHGTILPALYEWKRRGAVGEVSIAGTRREGVRALESKVRELDRLYGFKLAPRCWPEGARTDARAYRAALAALPRPACAVVVVPDDRHREVAGHAVEHGLHTLVVKPLAPTVREVRELIALQQRSGVYCAVEFHKRLDRSNLKLRDTLAGGKIGDPLYVVVEYSQRKSIPLEQFSAWVRGTNIFQYLGIHYVDIIHFATGARPVRAMAVGQKRYLAARGVDAYDAIQAVVEWRAPGGGAFTSGFFTSWVDPERSSAMSDQRIKVIGTAGRYEADQKRRGIQVVSDAGGVEEPNPDFCVPVGDGAGGGSYQGYGIDSVLQFLDDAARVAQGRLHPEDLEGLRPTFRQSLVPTVVVEAVNRSLARGGAWVGTRFAGGEFKGFA